jgi:hypothetical protein
MARWHQNPRSEQHSQPAPEDGSSLQNSDAHLPTGPVGHALLLAPIVHALWHYAHRGGIEGLGLALWCLDSASMAADPGEPHRGRRVTSSGSLPQASDFFLLATSMSHACLNPCEQPG